MRTILFSILILFALSYGTNCQAQELIKFKEQVHKELEERQRVEKINYEKACQKGTIEAYNEYLKMYPHGKYVHHKSLFMLISSVRISAASSISEQNTIVFVIRPMSYNIWVILCATTLRLNLMARSRPIFCL